MILLVDIGNSYTKIKLGDTIKEEKTNLLIDKKDVESFLDVPMIEGAVISSVVIGKAELFKDAIMDKFMVESLIVTPYIRHSLDYGRPELNELGPDLMCLMEGISKNANSFIGVSLGTASVVMVVKDLKFMGCAISPGAETSLRSLIDSASLIGETNLDGKFELLGLTTESSVKSGVYNSAVFIIDGYIDKIKEEYGNLDTYVMGGLSSIICGKMKNKTTVRKDLIFDGLLSLYEINKAR